MQKVMVMCHRQFNDSTWKTVANSEFGLSYQDHGRYKKELKFIQIVKVLKCGDKINKW